MSNFQCPHCGMVNIDCESKGYKTPREIELEKRVKELEQANIHIDNNRKCKTKKLKEIEQLLIDCSSGYTDEVMQKIMEIIHKPETVCFENKYEQALEEIKEYTRKQFCDNCEDIGSTEYSCHCEYCEYQEYLDIINKAKGE